MASTVLGTMAAVFSIIALWTYLETGENLVALFILIPVAIVLIITVFKPTISTLTPEGVEVKAWGGTVFNKWSDVDDLRVYRRTGYMGVGRRYVTFQDETKRLQKHVFLVPINIFSKPSEVLEIVKFYREAALKELDET